MRQNPLSRDREPLPHHVQDGRGARCARPDDTGVPLQAAVQIG